MTNKPKIWKEWKRVIGRNWEIKLLHLPQCSVSWNQYKKGYQIGCLNLLLLMNGNFKTKEQAMLKAQSLILKEFRKIQQVMRDKV